MLKSKKLITILFLAIALSSCENTDSANINTQAKENIKVMQTDVVTSNGNQHITKFLDYSGTIDNIKIHMHLEFLENGQVIGEYAYDKYNVSIPINGQVEGNKISLETKEQNEKFIGIIQSSYISGEWTDGDKVLTFHLNNEVVDEYATFANMKIAYDSNFVYYIIGNNIYKSDFNGENTKVILEKKALDNIVVYKERVYFIDSENFICSIDVDGGNLKRFDTYDNVTNFIIYKESILFLDVKYEAEDIFKINSIELQIFNIDGSVAEIIDLTKYILVSSETEKLKNYYISCVYNDYIYFNSLENGIEADFFRVGLKNLKIEKVNGLGEIIEPIDDEIIYLAVNSSNVVKDKILISDESNYLELYSGPDIYKNDDLQYFDIVSNQQFIVIGYAIKDDDYYTIDILNLRDNSISTNLIDKSIEDTGLSDTLNMLIVGNYIYYTYNNIYDNTNVELNKIVIN